MLQHGATLIPGAMRVQARMAECPYRRDGGCGAVDIHAGWGCHNLTMDECDACYDAGRGVGAASVAWRGRYVATLVANIKARLADARANVIEAIIRKHCRPEERAGLLRAGALKLGREKAVELADRVGIVPEIEAMFDAMTPQEIADAGDPAEVWGPHGVRWAEIEAEIEAGGWQPSRVGWLGAAWSFVRALWSSRGFRRGVDVTTLDTRTISCTGKDLKGTRHKAACPSLRRSGKGWHYCGHCRCGDRKAARLDGPGFTKLMHPALTCPRQMPGFASLPVGLTVGGKVPDAPRSIRVKEG